MPGLVGLITRKSPEAAQAELAVMLGALSTESFYTTACWSDPAQGLYVGWTARKGTPAERSPFYNPTREVTLLYSGEDFGVATSSQPDAIGSLCDEAKFPANLNGRFQGLMFDRRTSTATLFNDRYGLHRLYYHRGADAFYFAVEAKAILRVKPELRQLDTQSLGEWLSCGCVLQDRSLFRGVHVLPAASAWTFRDGALVAEKKYFEPGEWESQGELTTEEYFKQLQGVFQSVLPRYFANGKIGISLTGGLDTRMIMAEMHAPANRYPCYSFASAYRDCEDVSVARRVAKAAGQTHRILPLDQEYLKQFGNYAERTVFLTEGTNTVNRAADLYVNEQAREIAPVRMTGNYGGEVLRRVRAFKPIPPMAGLFSGELDREIETAKQSFAEIIQCHPLTFAAFRQAPWHHYGLLSLEENQVSLRTPFLDNEFVRTIFRAPASATTNDDICLRLIRESDPKMCSIRTDRGIWSSGLNRAWLEFTFKAEYAYDYGMPKPVATVDHALSALHLEKLFLGRHKFAHYRVWYRDALSSYVRDTLLSPRAMQRPYLQRGQVQRIVEGHTARGENFTMELHKVLTLELLHRLFLD